jgi:hypothetical protein
MTTPYYITNWCGIPAAYARNADGTLAAERIKEMADAGLTLLGLDDCGVQTNREMLAVCQEIGVKAILFEHRATAAVFDAQNREVLLQALVNDYRDCPALHSYHIIDEPNCAQFAAIGQVVAILRHLDPDREAYVNLFPNYASVSQLGNQTYAEHLEEYLSVAKPEILSYDHYHLIKERASTDITLADERQNAILHDAYRQVDRPGFFDNLEAVRAACRKHNTPFMLIVLLTEHGPYRDLTEAEIRYEVFQALAYGSVRMSYFTYWTPTGGDEIWHWQNGMIAKDGSRTQHYYDVQKINRDLQPLGQVLQRHTPDAIYHIGREPDALVTYWPGKHGAVQSIDAQKLTVSFFPDDLLLLASKDYRGAQTVTLTLSDGITPVKFCPASGAWEALPMDNACITLTLAAGDAVLLQLK